MSNRRREDGKKVSAAQLGAQLGQLRGIEPPRRLRETLLAGVPVPATGHVGPDGVSRWLRAVRYVGVAAAILVVASLGFQRLAPLGGPPRIIADMNDRSGRPGLVDHHHPLPRDINVCDNNAVP